MSGHCHFVFASRPRLGRRFRFPFHVGKTGGEFDVGSDGFVPGNLLAGFASHPPHNRSETGFGAALGFVVRPIVADGVKEQVVFDLIMIAIRSLVAPEQVICLLYTSPSPRDGLLSRMPSSA